MILCIDVLIKDFAGRLYVTVANECKIAENIRILILYIFFEQLIFASIVF